MSRSGYSDDCEDQWGLIRWRGAVASAIRGKKGQALLRELLAELDAMPVKELIAHELVADGQFCTLGVLGAKRGLPLETLDPEDYDSVAAAFGVNPKLVQEIVYENDESIADYEYVDIVGPPVYGRHFYGHPQMRQLRADAGQRRWNYMRNWIAKHITPEKEPTQ